MNKQSYTQKQWEQDLRELEYLLSYMPDTYTDDQLTVDDITDMTQTPDEKMLTEQQKGGNVC